MGLRQTRRIGVPALKERISSVSVDHSSEPTRRDFLYIATGAAGVVGAAAAVWPFIDQMNPDAATLALAQVDVDISQIAAGQSITAKWRGKPIFIRQRTPKEIEEGKAVDLSALKDPIARNANLPGDAPATDVNRAAEGQEQWLVMVGVCTHLGCVPLGQSGDYDGWYCPCHGSHYDTAGRIRKGPAPENMAVPLYTFPNPTTVRIG
ncbi:ubiquinol-cytochrome c reductase iron-sulfur subunit [Aureimonas flava]|uniref:Ubiquinol-cytochrome c reductase iron-sulfur subunit n=1 Tax=Aureimonas flava TaxID=2320271 RepID=A0A3A1WPZ4_9HYPH|nr:ubiquinol-cytochrome c reductase iron-sulfur subunit [Aureimonas flava]